MISKSDRNQLVASIVERWGSEEQKYARLEELVSAYLKDSITATELLPTITHRVKTLLSMVKTAMLKNKSYDQINDKVGFRIICHFKSEMPVIRTFLEHSFHVWHFESKADKLKFDALGYVSDHYDVSLKPGTEIHSHNGDLGNLKFEIQVRTICQHAWADVEHSLAYKQDTDLEDPIKRRVFRLTSLLEICDDEFDSVNDYLLGLPQSRAFAILHCIEGKFFKYAKRSFDKDISIALVGDIINRWPIQTDWGAICQDLKAYLNENDERIRQIFAERSAQLDTDYFLSQPEILFIWYLIEKYPHEMIAVWRPEYDIEDLYDLSIIWGAPITIPQ